VQFVEKESGLNCHIDWRSAEEMGDGNPEMDDWEKKNRDANANAAKEMWEIYTWWTKGRKEEHDALEELEGKAFNHNITFTKMPDGLSSMETNQTPEQKVLMEQAWQMEDTLLKKDEEMIIRLVRVAGHMWT
jgi:hypothetical protein